MASKGVSTEKGDYRCPIPAAHDKYTEAHYFIAGILREYHNPEPFRWNLNAFLQALRSVTVMIQSEMSSVAGFQDWYETQRESMRKDPLLRRFVEGRDIVVHAGMLNARSKVEVGLFRGQRLKLAQTLEIPPNMSSEEALKRGVDFYIGFLLDEEHSAIDEQIGVRRSWVVEELGSEEVILLCDRAWSRIGKVLEGAHALVGSRFEAPPEEVHDIGEVNLLRESDIDPTLPRKWGWGGMLIHPITLIGPSGDREMLEALVDIDASFTSVPGSVLKDLGVEPHRSIRLRMPNNEVSEFELGRVLAEINGSQEQILCVFSPIDGPVIGAQTLETFLLATDASEERLLPKDPLLTRYPLLD